MKALVCLLSNNLARPIHSHKSSPAVMYADMIAQTARHDSITINYHDVDDWNEFDEVYIYFGNDWNGKQINFIGGIDKQLPEGYLKLSKFKGKVYTLDRPMMDLAKRIKYKMNNARALGKVLDPSWDTIDFAQLERLVDTAVYLPHPNKTDSLVIGDSHAICMYRPGWMVNSVPMTTLNGALNKGLEHLIGDVEGLKNLEIYLGNIDVRHHLVRLGGIKHTEELADRLTIAVKYLPYNTSVYELLPIENESRDVPTSGWYKGQPFWGSWEERNNARLKFKERLVSNGIKVIQWTDYLLNDKGELSFDYMEKPRSIHLSREFYPYWQGQGFNYAKGSGRNQTVCTKASVA